MKRMKDIESAFSRVKARQRIEEADAIARYCVGRDPSEVARWLGLPLSTIDESLYIHAMANSLGELSVRKYLIRKR